MGEKKIDHNKSNKSKLVCNIADTSLTQMEAAKEAITIIWEMVGNSVNSRRPPVVLESRLRAAAYYCFLGAQRCSEGLPQGSTA
jgi:hypothetical protein